MTVLSKCGSVHFFCYSVNKDEHALARAKCQSHVHKAKLRQLDYYHFSKDKLSAWMCN